MTQHRSLKTNKVGLKKKNILKRLERVKTLKNKGLVVDNLYSLKKLKLKA
ncbi:MAG: small basic protein [Candidatus Organicella extenuata]|uniref:Small basic protein n=1 Tax=Candidatus Organicella extenuata TaxID=2841811 RepID=A0AA51GED9_9BACT|nr:MAG: small basic protein [Candidatus Organicella extenuata]